MPFNGSGTYVPPGLPVFPPSPGQVISSNYYTQLINDIASALSLTFLRDGSVSFTGDFNIGGNSLKNLADGSAASPSIRFNTDANTGVYLNGTGKLCFAVGGVKVAEFTTTGLTIPGTLAVTGATSLTGNLTGTTATFSGAVATGVLTASGAIKRDNTFYLEISGNDTILNWDTNDAFYFTRTTNTVSVLIGGAIVATINSSRINANGLQVNGSNVWHAGNLTPTNYALLSGAAFTGGITGTTGTFTGLVNAGGLQVSGNAVWHAGNFTPTNYALLSGATFSGPIKRDNTFYLELSGSNPVINWDANDWDSFDRTANKRYINIGGVAVFSVDGSGNIRLLGNITGNAGSV